MKHWTKKTLADVSYKIQSGGTPKADNPNFYDGNIPFVSIEDITSSNKFLRTTQKTLSIDGLNNCSAWIIPPGSVLYSIYATLGIPIINTLPVASSQAILGFVPNTEKIYTEFLYYWLSAQREKIVAYAGHTTQSNLSAAIVRALEIDLPPLPEQTRIVEVLSAIDKTIETTSALIAKHERIKIGMMQDLLSRGLDEQGNLRDPQTYRFKPSPLGDIPEEWEVGPLAHYASVSRGQFSHRPRNDPAFYGGSTPFIQTGDITRNAGKYIDEFSQTLNEKGKTVSREFGIGTIAITIAANIGDTAILKIPMYFPDSVVGISVFEGNIPRYFELCLRQKKQEYENIATQSAQKNINLAVLRPSLIPVPTREEQMRIAQAYEAEEEIINSHQTQLSKLQRLKAGLMTDLFSGRIDVSSLSDFTL